MSRELMQDFFSMMTEFDGRDYIMSTIALGAAPTLKGLKPSALFSFSNNARDLYRLWENYKHEICASFGLSFFELKRTEEQLLVLLYKRELLELQLMECRTKSFLADLGYDNNLTLEESLKHLKSRFSGLCPHEIGIFLGIPVEDVVGFIKYKGAQCILCRYWKVYCNPEHADRLFKSFDMAKISIMKSIYTARRNSQVVDYELLKSCDYVPDECCAAS